MMRLRRLMQRLRAAVSPAPRRSHGPRVIDRPESDEVRFVGMMRDIDELMTDLREQYPDHTWSRGEVVQLMYCDLTTDKLEWIGSMLQEHDAS
jgi:hypothetical protein